MRPVGFLLSLAVAFGVGYSAALWLGALLTVVCLAYQVLGEISRSSIFSACITPASPLTVSVAQAALFLIPLLAAIVAGSWLAAAGTVLAFLLNLLTQ